LPHHLGAAAEFRLSCTKKFEKLCKHTTRGGRARLAKQFARDVQATRPGYAISATSLWRWLSLVHAGNVAGLVHPMTGRCERRRRSRRFDGTEIPTANLGELAAILESVQRRLVQLADETENQQKEQVNGAESKAG